MNTENLKHDLDLSEYEPFSAEALYYAVAFLHQHYKEFSLEPILNQSSESDSDAFKAFSFYMRSRYPKGSPGNGSDLTRLWNLLIGKGKAFDDFKMPYSLWAQAMPDSWWTFMNWGFYDFQNKNSHPPLEGLEADWRYAIQLYYRALDGVSLKGKDVLEVGSGRGGGAAHLARAQSPNSYVGLDGTCSNTIFCRDTHHEPNLQFIHGDAENLALPDESFDVLINIESCQIYSYPERFLAEASRVLRPDGYLCIATVAQHSFFMELVEACEKMGFKLLALEDITGNVYTALEAFNMADMIQKHPTSCSKELYLHFFELTWHMNNVLKRNKYYYRLCFQC